MLIKRKAPKARKVTARQVAAYYANPTDEDIIHDTVEVATTITTILLGALIEPGRDPERWTRARIRELLAAGNIKRFRTMDILISAQHKASAFDWLRFYFNKLQLTKAEGGGHLHRGQIVDVDYDMPVRANMA